MMSSKNNKYLINQRMQNKTKNWIKMIYKDRYNNNRDSNKKGRNNNNNSIVINSKRK